MDTEQAAQAAGLTYAQLDYAIRNGIVYAPPTKPGRTREFTARDLALLKLYGILREDGYKPQETREAIAKVEANWKDDDPENAGSLLVIDGEFVWSPDVLSVSSRGESIPLAPRARFFYNVRLVAYEALDQIETEN
jgi:DNA-binding transcriptional MerR regulator